MLSVGELERLKDLCHLENYRKLDDPKDIEEYERLKKKATKEEMQEVNESTEDWGTDHDE